MISNSTKNKRGVAILYKCSLDIKIIRSLSPPSENILAVSAEIKGTHIILIAIYGPNTVDASFFSDLDELILSFPNVPVIIAGDWNCTVSTEKIENNIDCQFMRAPPNITHSKKLRELCIKHELADPYRYLYVDKKEFSYQPRNVLSKNRSRIDFFIVSDSILDSVSECKIADSLQNKLFDHKAVQLILNKVPEKSYLILKNFIWIF
jgi:exonuclease III